MLAATLTEMNSTSPERSSSIPASLSRTAKYSVAIFFAKKRGMTQCG